MQPGAARRAATGRARRGGTSQCIHRRARGIAPLVLAALLVTSAAQAADEWAEVDRSHDASEPFVISRRPAEHEGMWTYRLVTRVDAPPEVVARAVFVVLTDDRYVPDGRTRTTLAVNEHDVLNHVVVDLPLAADRDAVNRVVIDGVDAEGVHRVHWHEVTDAGPAPRPGIIRIPWLRGSFALEPEGVDSTEVEYKMGIDLGGSLPAALVRGFLPRQMKAQIRVLRRAVAELREGEGRSTTREPTGGGTT